MFKIIRNLQKEPEEKRRKVAFLVALFITLVVVGAWALSLPSKFDDSKENNVASAVGPVESFFNIISSSFNTLKEGL